MASWADHDELLIKRYNEGKSAKEITDEIREKYGVDRRIEALHKRVYTLKQLGRIATSKKLRAKAKAAESVSEEVVKATSAVEPTKQRLNWSDEESELMWQAVASGASHQKAADVVNKKFGNKRTARKVIARLGWLKAKAKKAGAPTGTGRKPPKNALALARQNPAQMSLPVDPIVSVAEQRHVRIDFPEGAIALSVSGVVPPAVREALNQILWA